MNIANTKPSTEKQEAGVWLEYSGSRFLVRCSRTAAYNACLMKALRAMSRADMKRNPGIATKVTKDTLFKECLRGWENVTTNDLNGKEVEFQYTQVNKEELKSDPDFCDWLADASADMDNFKLVDPAETEVADQDDLKSSSSLVAEVGEA